MEGFSAIIESVQVPLSIPVRTCLADHRFDGRAVLPAVEAMEVLARAAAGRFRPHAPVSAVTGLRFDRFLTISPEMDRLPAFCEFSRYENGDLKAVLATRTVGKKSALTRVKAHATMIFPRPEPLRPDPVQCPDSALEEGGFSVPNERIYPELIPFGPFYRNVVALRAGVNGVVAEIRTPIENTAAEGANVFGSPFALDAAFHAACVWGQRFAGIVAFPVAMDQRRVYAPTRAGRVYSVNVIPVLADGGLLVFELRIFGRGGILHEVCSGVRMRDVSGGRLKPPLWVRTPAGGAPAGPE